MSEPAQRLHRVWRAAQLYIGFQRDRQGNRRNEVKLWSPKDARASIHADPAEQECFVNVLTVEGGDEPGRDVQIALHPDRILLRRNPGPGWRGIVVGEHGLALEVNGIRIRIDPDGTVKHEKADCVTWIEADGSIIKTTPAVEAMMSSDGVELTRRTGDSVAAIRENGILSKTHDRDGQT